MSSIKLNIWEQLSRNLGKIKSICNKRVIKCTNHAPYFVIATTDVKCVYAGCPNVLLCHHRSQFFLTQLKIKTRSDFCEKKNLSKKKTRRDITQVFIERSFTVTVTLIVLLFFTHNLHNYFFLLKTKSSYLV